MIFRRAFFGLFFGIACALPFNVAAQSGDERLIDKISEEEGVIKIISTPSSERWQVAINPPTSNLLIRIADNLPLQRAHIDLLQVGTPMVFNLELSINQPRWFGWDKVLAQVTLPIRIGFDPVSEIYWFSRLQQTQSFRNLEELQKQVLTFTWSAIPASVLPSGKSYAHLELSIDQSSLPLPIQMEVRPNHAWRWKKIFPNLEINQ